MFRAARERFGTAWRSAREKRLFGLFAFEFVVVVLGVLTAQAVQSWAQERAQKRETDEAIVRLEHHLGNGEDGARIWLAAEPCLRSRVGQIMRIAAAGEPLPAGFSDRPLLGSTVTSNEGEAMYDRVARRVGDARATALFDMMLRRQRMADGKQNIIARWELFRLIDPAFGVPSPADRASVRLAAAEILADLRNVTVAADYMIEIAGRTPGGRRVAFDRAVNIVPVRTCAELWAKGTAYRKLDPGEALPY